MFANIPEALAQSTDFLHHEVGLLHHDPLLYAQYATSYFETNLMQSIELTGEARSDSATSTSSRIPSHLQRNASPSRTTVRPKNSWAMPRRT